MQHRVIGAFWGPGTYFEVLDKDGNFDDYGQYGGYRKGQGQQYKVYIDLDPKQVLDTTKSFNDYGMSFSTEEAIDFILNSSLMRDGHLLTKELKIFFELKNTYNNFNDIISKRAAFGKLIETYNVCVQALTRNSIGGMEYPFTFNPIFSDDREQHTLVSDIKQYGEMAAELLGENNFTPEIENTFNRMVETGEIGTGAAARLLKAIKFLGDRKKVEQLFSKIITAFFRMIKESLNKYPMFHFLEWRSTKAHIKWFMDNFNVYGKIVPEIGNGSGGERRYLIMWKTTGIVKKVGERRRKEDKFSDEIEDEAQAEEIDNMLQYAGA